MAQVIEAIFSGGIFKPVEHLALKECQRVRLLVEPIDEPINHLTIDRDLALKKLIAGIQSVQFFSKGDLPSRDELHDRV